MNSADQDQCVSRGKPRAESMNKRKILTSLAAPAMLVSLILVATACGEGAKPAAAPVSSGTIEGVVNYADGGPVLGMRLIVVDGMSRAERNCTGRAEQNYTTERRGVSIEVSWYVRD